MLRRAGLMLLAACLWLPCLQLIYRSPIERYRIENGISPVAQELTANYLAIWSDPVRREQELAVMRKMNPEWDFMSRTFMTLALANMALRDPAFQPQALEIMDAIIADTLARERGGGHEHFLLGYGRRGGWLVDPPRSIFIDGEITMMLCTRRWLEEHEDYRIDTARRVRIMLRQMNSSPVLCGESYPNECWLFCNSVALASIRMADVLDDTDNSEFIRRWVATARLELMDHQTGLLISAFSVTGDPAPAAPVPEGSSIWMATHMLELVDADFAKDQYQRARKELGRTLLGFGFAREWPKGLEQRPDIDSGPIIPVLGASASSSGLALLAAATFDDRDYFTSLMTSLEFMGFPVEQDGKLHYRASNQVGDSVLLYALTEGPLWDQIQSRSDP
ncbi:MAG: hypothetical protein ACPGVU_14200 [Limisphaerales bacterium]